MATTKQIEANRLNALRSTGPKTPEGKAASSRNALRHGLRARAVVFPGEDRAQFQRLCDQMKAQWQPRTPTQRLCLEQMAVSRWKLPRMELAEASLFVETATAIQWIHLLNLRSRTQCRLDRDILHARDELEHLQLSRTLPPPVFRGGARDTTGNPVRRHLLR